MTIPHEEFVAKIRASPYAFLELGIDDGIILPAQILLVQASRKRSPSAPEKVISATTTKPSWVAAMSPASRPRMAMSWSRSGPRFCG